MFTPASSTRHFICTSLIWFCQGILICQFPYIFPSSDLNCNDISCCNALAIPSTELENYPPNQWDIVCKDGKWTPLVSVLYFVVMASGIGFYFFLARKFGRIKLVITALLLSSISAFLLATSILGGISSWFISLLLLSFESAGALSFVHLQETIDESKRVVYAAANFIASVIGIMAMSLKNYTIPSWTFFLIFIGMISLLCIAVLARLEESPRYLAVARITRIALDGINIFHKEQDYVVISQQKAKIELEQNENRDIKVSEENPFVAINSNPVAINSNIDCQLNGSLKKRLLCISCLGFISSFSYYSICFSTSKIVGSPDLSIMANAFFECVSFTLMAKLINKAGIKLALMIGLALSGIFSISALTFIASQCTMSVYCRIYMIIRTPLLIFARISISSIKLLAFIYTFELVATRLRDFAFAILIISLLVGYILSPVTIWLISSSNFHILFVIGPILIASSISACWTTESSQEKY